MLDPESTDRLIQRYDTRYNDVDRAKHAALAVALLGGVRANDATAARAELAAVIAGSAGSPPAVALWDACGQSADMARAALEYQVRINEVILGLPAR